MNVKHSMEELIEKMMKNSNEKVEDQLKFEISAGIKSAVEKDQTLLDVYFTQFEESYKKFLSVRKSFLLLQLFSHSISDQAAFKLKFNPQIFKAFGAIAKTVENDQKMKLLVASTLKNLIIYSSGEFVQSLELIFTLILNLFAEQDEGLIAKGKECDESLKAKFLFFFENQSVDGSEVVKKILDFLKRNFYRENLNVKSWCLVWYNFLINLDSSNIMFLYSVLIIDFINFMGRTTNPELKANADGIMKLAERKFLTSDFPKNLEFALEFTDNLLQNYTSKTTDENQRIVTLRWVIPILKIALAEPRKQKVQSCECVENIISSVISIVLGFNTIFNEELRNQVMKLNELAMSNFVTFNGILEDNMRDKTQRFAKVIDMICKLLGDADNFTINILISWNELLLDVMPERFFQELESYIKILDSKNDQVLNSVIKFIANFIQKLSNFNVTTSIISYFFKNKTGESNLAGFLKFIKILFDRIKNVDFLLIVFQEISKHSKEKFFPKIVQNFNLLLIFEENFKFLRDLLKAVKYQRASEKELTLYKEVFSIWIYHDLSFFSLCILSGNYRQAYETLVENFTDEPSERDLLQLSEFVKTLELPYLSYIRVDLLDLKKNFYLYKSLQTVLMILPQGEFFDLLKNRLKCISYHERILDGGLDEKDAQGFKYYPELKQLYNEHQAAMKQV